VTDATCAGCGCACDDIEATIAEGRLAGLTRTCELGDAWFAKRTAERPPLARIEGRAVSLDEAADAAAAILRGARAPLVSGLGETSCEAQRRAVAIAEAAGAVLDPAGGGPAGLAYQALGSSTATFGEIRDRAELVVAWRADPAVTNPRLLGRLRLDRAARTRASAAHAGPAEPRAHDGAPRPRGDGPRTLVVVDSQRTATADEADAFVALDAALDFEALWALRALVGRAPLDRDRAGELPLDGLDELAERLLAARHVAVVYGELGDEPTALALFELVRDLSRDRHAVALALRREGNTRGAEDVLAWQTGFPAAVSFARGYPRANAGELGAAGLLERGEVDAALVVASDPLAHLPAAAADRLRELPLVVVDVRATATAGAARVAFAAAVDGVEVAGTVHRMDGVPIPLRAPLGAERPSVEDVLAAIAGRM
jgi:formylmethanofuran dehydrogenase subunit B